MKINGYLFCASLVWATACYPDKDKKVDLDKLRFTTTDASELFFKNVRKSAYVMEDLPGATLQVYRAAKPDTANLLISPALVINWGNDQAFLIMEMAEDLPDEMIFLFTSAQHQDTVHFNSSHQRAHAELALRMYNALLDQKQILLLQQGDVLPLFTVQEKRDFRRIVFDFLRLVELR